MEGETSFDDPVPAGQHRHFRHPQTLVCTLDGRRFDLVGMHLKSKFAGDDAADAGRVLHEKGRDNLSADDAERVNEAERKAVAARIKLTTECVDVRYWIDSRFRSEPHPAIFLLGDFNDGPGKEWFERRYLFNDAVSNLQGEVFFARRFLNHALFDFSEEHRWSVRFRDAWDPTRPENILLDHILFTQSVVGDDAPTRTGLRVRGGAGKVEHAAHVAANAPLEGSGGETSDHRPVSVTIEVATALPA